MRSKALTGAPSLRGCFKIDRSNPSFSVQNPPFLVQSPPFLVQNPPLSVQNLIILRIYEIYHFTYFMKTAPASRSHR